MRPLEYKTKVGEEILLYLASKKDIAVSVMDILNELERKNVKSNITTIYRQLEKLVIAKKVIIHSANDGKKGLYQYVADEQECFLHLHIQCTECAKIIHLNCAESKEFTFHIEQEHGIILDFSKTMIYGLCSECATKKKKTRNGNLKK